ncbi:MAG: class I SAM-dependent methyltransferase [Planctomycetes bacterium]|nr:class I SAM-dependent methyltransferase [Planctomycetota bacterium]
MRQLARWVARAFGRTSTAPRARGFFEYLDDSDGRLAMSGWMLLDGPAFESVRIEVGGERLGIATPIVRNDVAAEFSWLPAASQSGFGLRETVSAERLRDWVAIEAIGERRGRDAGKLATLYRSGFRRGLPQPPAALMHRVATLSDPMAYFTGALQNFGELRTAIRRHCRGPIARLLDWGCGCGRLTSFLIRDGIGESIHGCDVEPELVAWCATNLAPGRFVQSPDDPPLPYDDGSFDVVVNYGTLTNLQPARQMAWLRELARVLAPGGHLLVSVNGEFAADYVLPAQNRGPILSELRARGISDGGHADVVPWDQYRGTYQTRAHTFREWSRILPIVAYEERVMSHLQDLVVLARPR